MSDGHVQTAIEDRRGWWHVECQCGARGWRRATNYEAWRVPLEHRTPAAVSG